MTINEIYRFIENCKRCRLKEELEVNKVVVKSSGEHNAPIMIIAKNPSYMRRGDRCFGNQDQINYPVIDKMLSQHKFSCEDTYRTNIVKCSTKSNKDPDDECLKPCIRFLDKEIEIVNPKIILCAGKFVSNHFGLKSGVKKEINGRLYLAIVHPSSLSYHKNRESEEKYMKQIDIISKELRQLKGDKRWV